MTILIVIIGVFLLLIIGSLMLALLIFNQAKTPEKTQADDRPPPVKFRLKQVVFSVAVLLLTVILVIWVTPRLPADVGYNFGDDGSPTEYMSRASLIVWTFVPQILLTLLALLVGWGVNRLGNILRTAQGSDIPFGGLAAVMGNLIGLPQLIIAFAMSHIYFYNAYQITLFPIWVFTLVVMGIAGIILGAFFMGLIQQSGGFSFKEK